MTKVHFRSYIHKKMILFPQRIDKDIAEDDPVRLLDALVDNLMLEKVYRLYKPSGRKPYHPQMMLNPSLTPTFAYFLQSPSFPRFSYGLCVLQILFFLYGECFKFNLSYICFACFEGLLHWRISMFSPNGFFPFVVTNFWVLIRRTISVQ